MSIISWYLGRSRWWMAWTHCCTNAGRRSYHCVRAQDTTRSIKTLLLAIICHSILIQLHSLEVFFNCCRAHLSTEGKSYTHCTSHTGEGFNLLDNYSVIYLEKRTWTASRTRSTERDPLGRPARLSGTRLVDLLTAITTRAAQYTLQSPQLASYTSLRNV